eukprot:TRINITY_DN41625_c0_g1_i1.p1 TRINITY_DN41625_c0_g1~~TRINITY_DN41625_c0_g1_i1.p1  ORF type:complete len:1211 (+),score=268.80 TRINITY_DN41625_c0_g1_i1:174-3806(+)
MDGTLLAEENDCGRALIRLLSRGHAIVAELQRVADHLPPAFLGIGPEAVRYNAVLPDFDVFRKEGAVDRVATTQELIELDEESRDMHFEGISRVFHVLAAIRKYASDLIRFLNDLESGMYLSQSPESVARDPVGCQLMAEAIALLGTMLLLLEERLPGSAREKALVAFHRFTVGTADAAEEYPDVCRLFRATGRPSEANMAKRNPGYPEGFFARFPLPRSIVRVVIGQLQTNDVYGSAQHYPLPEHRSHSLAAQAGLLYSCLFFDVETLESDVVAMREIVNRHFGDAWVVAYALGFTADLLLMWAPYPAAMKALSSAISVATVKQLRDRHCDKLAATRQQLKEYLTEGALTEEVVAQRTSALLSCLRQANTTIRWLLLQPTTSDPRLQAAIQNPEELKEQLLQALVDTALLEDRVRALLVPLLARKQADWVETRSAASGAMDDLAVYFSGTHALKRNVKNEELESWFRGLQARIDDLDFDSDSISLGRKISQLHTALEEVQQFHEISRNPHILHYLSDARELLQKLVRTVNLRSETLETITRAADLSYAWNALGAYQHATNALLAKNPRAVKGLRALFLKLASILEAPLLRIRQAKSEAHEKLVAAYYSKSLVVFMQNVLQEIPRLIFGLLHSISEQHAARPPEPLPSRISLEELRAYAERSEAARDNVGQMTQQIALLMRGIRETDVAVLGVLRLEPREVLVQGLRRELASKIEDQFARLVFSLGGRPSREDFLKPVFELAARCQSLSRAFEHVQDYLGISAMKLWHAEAARITRFMLHMELQARLKRRLPLARSCPHFDPDCPIGFPDRTAEATGDFKRGRSFVTRTAEALLAITEPKITAGGYHAEWREKKTGECLFDSGALEALHAALGPVAVSALSKLLGFRVAGALRGLVGYLAKETKLGTEQNAILQEAAKQACSAPGGTADAVRCLHAAAQRCPDLLKSLVETLAVVGQHQLLRRRLHGALRLHCHLEAPLAAGAINALDDAQRLEALESVDNLEAAGDDALPTIWEFTGEGSPDEQLLALQRRVARASELCGHGDPFRQLYTVVMEGEVPRRTDVLLVLALLFTCAAPAPAAPRPTAAPRKRDTLLNFLGARKSVTAAAAAVVEEDKTPFVRSEDNVALAAGMATMLQQLPRAVTDGLLELCGACLTGLCVEGAEGKDASWSQGARLIDMLETLLEMLGLPAARIADVVPQALIDLWPAQD